MMKRYSYHILIIILIPFLSSCAEWLDIRPDGEVVLEDYWQNETQVNQVVMSCYRSMTESDYIRRMVVWGEVRSDNMVRTKNTDSEILKILDVDIGASNLYAGWAPMYRTINYCNTFLHFADTVLTLDENFTISKYLALEAEVLSIRALSYFYLLRTFGEVPLILEPSIDDTQEYSVAKSSERDILDRIIADLVRAEQNARVSYDAAEYPKSRFTRSGVQALLADIYLWDEQYEAAIDMCNRVMENSQLRLEEGENLLRKVFYEGNSTESIIELPFNDEEMSNSGIRSFYGDYQNSNGQLSFPIFLVDGNKSPFDFQVGLDKESEEDIRALDFINVNADRNEGYYYIFKYAGIERYEQGENYLYLYSNVSTSWILYRLPDVLLMKAEALVQLNRNESDLREALSLVNETYLRSNFEPGTDSLRFESYSDVINMEELVLRERHRELMFEGKRWYDLLRLARREGNPDKLLNYVAPKFTGDQALQYSKMSVMDALYMPIHQDELDINPELKQNPFYEITGSGSVKN